MALFHEMTTLTEPEMTSHAMHSAILRKLDSINANVVITAQREIPCKTLHSDFVRSIISRMCKINLTFIDDERKSSVDRNHKNVRHDATTGGQIAPKMETRILRYSTLTDIHGNNSKESFTASKTHPIGRDNKINEFGIIINNFTNNNSTSKKSRDKDLTIVKTGFTDRDIISEQEDLKKVTFNDNLFTTELSDLENQFELLKEIPIFSLDEDIIKSNRIVAEKREKSPTNTISPTSFQENVTSVPKIFSRRTFQLPWNVPWSKDQNMQNQPHVSRKEMDKISTMDEILKAVHQVLPAKESAKIPSEEPKVMSGVS